MSDATQARLFDAIPTESEQVDHDRRHENDPTPRGVVRQALDRLLEFRWSSVRGRKLVHVAGEPVGNGGPLTALDWCAGSGAWSSELRAWASRNGVDVEITAVEIRPEEAANLDRWADRVIIGDWTAALDHGPFDLVVSNPAFSLFLAGLPRLLEHAESAIVLHTTETLQRTEAGAALARSHPPTLELGIPGSVRYRGASQGADLRIYSVSAWTRAGVTAGSWTREILPTLPPAARGWRERPGAEQVLLPSWPTRPGWVAP